MRGSKYLTIMRGTHCNSDQKTNYELIWEKIQGNIYCDEESKGFIYKKKRTLFVQIILEALSVQLKFKQYSVPLVLYNKLSTHLNVFSYTEILK